jgi:hypothetical protein
MGLGVACLVNLTICGCASQKLRVVVAGKRQGTFPDVTCEFVGRDGPQSPYIAVFVSTPCITVPEVYVHVARGKSVLSTRKLTEPLRLPPVDDPNFTHRLESAPFSDVGSGVRLTAAVYSHCQSKHEPVNGEATCRTP